MISGRLIRLAVFFVAWHAFVSIPVAQSAVPLPPAPLRPSAEAGPTKISVAIWVGNISKIDSVAQTFSANLVIYLRWSDPRLVHDGPGLKKYALGDIWHPRWVIVNEAGSVERSLPETVNVSPDGMVVYNQRLIGSFSQALDLRHFPFDQDTFRVHFVVTQYSPNEIDIVPDEMAVAAGMVNGAGIAPELSLKDWRVISSTTRLLPYRVELGFEVAGYAFEFVAARRAQHFIVKVIIPLILIVMMSWAVFWVEPTDTGSQLGTSVTAMLTLIAYRFALDAEVPKLPYVTRLDAFVLASTLFVFLSLIEVLVTTKLAHCDRLAAARRIDRHARWVFPAAFFASSAVIFLR
jgi:hypothetical protein